MNSFILSIHCTKEISVFVNPKLDSVQRVYSIVLQLFLQCANTSKKTAVVAVTSHSANVGFFVVVVVLHSQTEPH